MHQEKYNFNWPTYSEHLREMLHDIRQSNELTDVTLVCDDNRQFKSHKIVLSAYSSVFKSIFTDLSQNSSVIYLRGIQHQEIESLLEFMYLGVATFYQERVNEFLNVAKSLEIKDISKVVELIEDSTNFNYEEKFFESNNDNFIVNKPTSTEGESKLIDDSQSQNISKGMFDCEQCGTKYTQKSTLKNHIQSIHEGVKYACNQCDYQYTKQQHLKTHIQSKHEGVRYPCNQCNYQATEKSHLKSHIKSVHEGVRYPCNQCDYQATCPSDVKKHFQSKHEGIKYLCDQCNSQFNSREGLLKHKKLKQSKQEGVKYACDQCNSQFNSREGLHRHKKLKQSKNEGVKYACDQCNSQLNSREGLFRHKKRKHNIKSIKQE